MRRTNKKRKKNKKRQRRVKSGTNKHCAEEKLHPTSELLRLETLQARNFQANIRGLAEVLIVYDALFEFTIDLRPLFGKMLSKVDSQLAHVLLMLYQCMRRDLMKAMLALCSGYQIDSTFHTRRIFETMAIFVELVRKPASLPFYIDLTTKDALANYVKNFMVFKLVRTNLSPLSLQAYEALCVFVHPSILTAGNTDIENGKHVMRFFDVRTEAAMPELRCTILQNLSMAFTGFKDMRLAFDGDEDFDSDAWEAACDKFRRARQMQLIELVRSGLVPPDTIPQEMLTDTDKIS